MLFNFILTYKRKLGTRRLFHFQQFCKSDRFGHPLLPSQQTFPLGSLHQLYAFVSLKYFKAFHLLHSSRILFEYLFLFLFRPCVLQLYLNNIYYICILLSRMKFIMSNKNSFSSFGTASYVFNK